MSAFLHPAFLWGLLGLSVPIAIHLLSRKEGKIVRVGSLRHLRTSESPTFKSIKINELLLLAVRCLLLAVMVFFISEWVSPTWWKAEKKKWVLVDPVIETAAAMEEVLDSLVADGYELRTLQAGFPEREEATMLVEKDYWSLVIALGKKTDTEVLIFSGNRFQDFSGKRVSLPANVKWISMPMADREFLVEAVQINNQEVLMRKGSSNPLHTSFEFKKQSVSPIESYAFLGSDSVLIKSPDTIRIAIFVDDKFQYDKKIIQASLQAINNSTPTELDYNSGKPDVQTDWVIWFSEDEPPADGKCIFYKEEHAPFFKQVSPTHWQITQRLNQEVASTNQLTTLLFDLLIPREEKSAKNDRRVMPEAMVWANDEANAVVVKAEASTNQQVLFVILMVLFLIERALAFVKKL